MPYTSGKRAHHAAARAVRLTAARHRILKFYDTSISFIVSLVNPSKSYILLYIIFAAALRARARIRAYACALARLRLHILIGKKSKKRQAAYLYRQVCILTA